MPHHPGVTNFTRGLEAGSTGPNALSTGYRLYRLSTYLPTRRVKTVPTTRPSAINGHECPQYLSPRLAPDHAHAASIASAAQVSQWRYRARCLAFPYRFI